MPQGRAGSCCLPDGEHFLKTRVTCLLQDRYRASLAEVFRIDRLVLLTYATAFSVCLMHLPIVHMGTWRLTQDSTLPTDTYLTQEVRRAFPPHYLSSCS